MSHAWPGRLAGVARKPRTAISKWEPRVGGVDVKANPDRYEENQLRIDVSYTILSTNTKRNMVYPFYLEGEEEE